MSTLHQTPGQPCAGSSLDSRGFQRQVFALLRLSGPFGEAATPRARGHAGRNHPARGSAHAKPDRASNWPTGCGLSLAEHELAVECSSGPMSWEV